VYTTVYTVTSCPGFDRHCHTGRVTTQTVTGQETASATGESGGGDGDGDDSGAARPGLSGALVAVGFSVLAGAMLLV
jgi:hypothetical protein